MADKCLINNANVYKVHTNATASNRFPMLTSIMNIGKAYDRYECMTVFISFMDEIICAAVQNFHTHILTTDLEQCFLSSFLTIQDDALVPMKHSR